MPKSKTRQQKIPAPRKLGRTALVQFPDPEIYRNITTEFRNMKPAIEFYDSLLARALPNGFPFEISWTHYYEKPWHHAVMEMQKLAPELMAELDPFLGLVSPGLELSKEVDFKSLIQGPDAYQIPPKKLNGLRLKRLVRTYEATMAAHAILNCSVILQRSMYRVLSEAKTDPQNKPLFDLLRIDRTIADMPFFKARLAEAHYFKDKKFISSWESALASNASMHRRKNEELDNVRLIVVQLNDYPSYRHATPTQILRYLCDDVKIDTGTRDEEAVLEQIKSIRRLMPLYY